MPRKKQGNTFLDISSRLSSIQTCQTPWGFLLPSVWIGATLRSKSEIFVFEFFFFQIKSNCYVITSEVLKSKEIYAQTEVRNCFD